MECQATFSPMQQEYLMNATHRWNFKTGATRSGKTYLDFAYVIPKRIMKLPPEALIMILGNTSNSVERNILRPMRNIYTKQLVDELKPNKNTVQMFGREVIIMGADKISQVPKIQGSGLDYAYGDEVATWNKNVFDMLKSRLDKSHSCFDGTCNPEHPSHWLKGFLDSDADIYHQHYTIDNNPFLTDTFVRELKKEYAGTVLYDRFILGKWMAAEGLVYEQFANDQEKYLIDIDDEVKKQLAFMTIGVDFGGNKSKTTFVADGFTAGYKKLIVLKDGEIKGEKGSIDTNKLCYKFYEFVMELLKEYPGVRLKGIYCDSEAQYLINSIRSYFKQMGIFFPIQDSKKVPIRDRIFAANMLFNSDRLAINRNCVILREGLAGALWSDKDPDKRLDDGTSDIDIMDGFEYGYERYINNLVPHFKRKAG